MNLPQDIVSGGAGAGKEALAAGSALVAIPGAIAVGRLVIDHIPESHAGLRTHAGRARRRRNGIIRRNRKKGELYSDVLESGRYQVGLGRGAIKQTCIVDRTHELEVMTVNSLDGQHNVKPMIKWGIIFDRSEPTEANPLPGKDNAENLYKAMFNIKDEDALTTLVKGISGAALNQVMKGFSSEEILDTDMVQEKVIGICNRQLEHYGSEVRGLAFEDALTDSQMNASAIEKQAQATEMVAQAIRDTDSPQWGRVAVASQLLPGLKATGS